MTVAYLWDSIEAGGEPLTDDALRGRTLAVDLSIWIVEARSSTALTRQHANPHLYLVVTRAVFLMKHGARIVAVLEGARSPLKASVSTNQQARMAGAARSSPTSTRRAGRRRRPGWWT